MGVFPRLPPQSEATSPMKIVGEETIRSGLPRAQVAASATFNGGGASFGLPSGAPASAHAAIISISLSESDTSSRIFWMPMLVSRNQGGIAPREYGVYRS